MVDGRIMNIEMHKQFPTYDFSLAVMPGSLSGLIPKSYVVELRDISDSLSTTEKFTDFMSSLTGIGSVSTHYDSSRNRLRIDYSLKPNLP